MNITLTNINAAQSEQSSSNNEIQIQENNLTSGFCKALDEEIKKINLKLNSPTVGASVIANESFIVESSLMEVLTVKDVPYSSTYKGKKTFEGSDKITNWSQYDLLKISSCNSEGFMIYDDRYLVALGSYFTKDIGQYFDLVLENGTIIPCILGDVKNDIHTDNTYHAFTVASDDCSEFIIKGDVLSKKIWKAGDVSVAYSEWDSPVRQVILYNKYVDL